MLIKIPLAIKIKLEFDKIMFLLLFFFYNILFLKKIES
jgi:hypothetical protein